MIATDNVPTNPNQLSQINFRFIMKRTPTLNYFCTKVNIPGAALPPVDQGTPNIVIPQYGDHLEFNPFVATFKLDEDLKNYFEIYSWMRALGNADDFANFKVLKEKPQYTGAGIKSDIVLTILNSSRNVNLVVTFNDCIPIELTDLNFDVQAPDIQTVDAHVVFKYLNFDYELVPKSA